MGGDSSLVQHQLQNVQHVHAAHYAIAAVLADGSVVTWGDPSFGGDSSAVQHQLRNVIQVCASHFAFAAILADGSIHMWGDTEGVCDTEVQGQLSVQQIQTTSHALVAIFGWSHGDLKLMVVTAL